MRFKFVCSRRCREVLRDLLARYLKRSPQPAYPLHRLHFYFEGEILLLQSSEFLLQPGFCGFYGCCHLSLGSSCVLTKTTDLSLLNLVELAVLLKLVLKLLILSSKRSDCFLQIHRIGLLGSRGIITANGSKISAPSSFSLRGRLTTSTSLLQCFRQLCWRRSGCRNQDIWYESNC